MISAVTTKLQATPVRWAEPGEKTTSLLAIAVQRGGLRKGSRAAVTVVSWAIAEADLGRPLGEPEGGHLSAAIREYAKWWKVTERTGWNDLQRFSEVFNEEKTPARIALMMRDIADGRARREVLIGQPVFALA